MAVRSSGITVLSMKAFLDILPWDEPAAGSTVAEAVGVAMAAGLGTTFLGFGTGLDG